MCSQGVQTAARAGAVHISGKAGGHGRQECLPPPPVVLPDGLQVGWAVGGVGCAGQEDWLRQRQEEAGTGPAAYLGGSLSTGSQPVCPTPHGALSALRQAWHVAGTSGKAVRASSCGPGLPRGLLGSRDSPAVLSSAKAGRASAQSWAPPPPVSPPRPAALPSMLPAQPELPLDRAQSALYHPGAGTGCALPAGSAHSPQVQGRLPWGTPRWPCCPPSHHHADTLVVTAWGLVCATHP